MNEEWKQFGACRNLPIDLFFPLPTDEVLEKEAKSWCAVCPVQEICLDYALKSGVDYGIWGGYNEEELRKIRKLRRIKKPKPLHTRGKRVREEVSEVEPLSVVDKLAQMLKERSGV